MKGSLIRGALLSLLWTAVCAAIVALDFATGPQIRFPIVFLVPITLIAWYHGRARAILLGLLLPWPRVVFPLLGAHEWALSDTILNALIRLGVFVFIAFLVATVARQKRALEREVSTLRGILPICMFCKKIRNDQGAWEQLEAYVASHSEAQFSHGMCADCAKEHYPEMFRAGGSSPRSP